MNKNWLFSNDVCSQISSTNVVTSTLPIGVYNVLLTREGFKLEKILNNFDFPFKVYGLQTDFIDHVIKTYENTTENLGILLTGVKGSGKTVTAKEICNRLNLPVIVVQSIEDHDLEMMEFLASIECECIFFFDEFEKNFDKENSYILQLTDGVYNSEFRKVFLLTTNETDVNNNLLGRPSRIRYVYNFGNLSIESVKDYLANNLKDQSKIDEIINYVDKLAISTIDILKTIVSEFNIHGSMDFSKKFFNVQVNDYSYFGKYAYAYLTNYDFEYILKDFKRGVELNKKPNLSDDEESEYRNLLFNNIYGYTFNVSKKIGSYKVGEEIQIYEYGEEYFKEYTIRHICREDNIIILTRGAQIFAIQVENWNALPSLYGLVY